MTSPFEQPLSSVGPYLEREWLETNGLGSYASSSVSGANTRRYHGLMVAALGPPLRRHVLLSRVDETLTIHGRGDEAVFPLSTSVYRGAVSPEGYRSLVSFEARPTPAWHFSAGGVELERRVWMPHGRQAVAICYRVLRAPADVAVVLSVRPMVAFRPFHDLAHENPAIDPSTTVERGRISIRPYEQLPRLFLHHNAEAFVEHPLWYRTYEYAAELERGFPAWEDLFTHGLFRFRLDAAPQRGEMAFLFASLDRIDGLTGEELHALEKLDLSRREERAGRAARARTVPAKQPPDRWSEAFSARLAEAAEQFLVSRADGRRSVIAGYHWFEDWGRDAFVSLPGLALATGRWPLAYELLRTFASYVDQGMVPNRFPDANGEPEYTSVDAALWLVEAARRYAHDTNDLSFIGREVFPRVEEIVEWYTRGTRFGIGVDPQDGLLSAGAEGVALTWMDAIVNGVPVTPRMGKPVEINALWHNALCSVAEMAEALGQPEKAASWRESATRTRESFNARFWNPATGCLYDVVDGPEGDDASIRPNQIFAVSLPHAPLRLLRFEAVVGEVERRLLTPMGLRTLDPADPRYRGRYEGGPVERDRAYHNGTVWPWLLGPFATAYLKAHGRSPETLARVRALVQPLSRHLGTEGCIGQISEIADGDEPHTPRGCVAQAWSVAEVARIVLEEIG